MILERPWARLENSGRAVYLQPAGLADIKGRHSRSYIELRPDWVR